MTKEPIMIDEVDVAECEHRCDTHKELLADGHIKEFVHYCQITNTGCYGYNCYYKQLKHKEQECEKIKQDNSTLFDKAIETRKENITLQEQLNQLKKENEQLKKYRSALEEIREDMEQDTTCESRECGCDDYAECLNCIKETILNKIREVLDV